MSGHSYWIIGAGRFGRLACERLRSRKAFADIRVVDRDGGKAAGIKAANIEIVTQDAVAFLRSNLAPQIDAWIIPAVPFHLAYAWLSDRLVRERRFRPEAVPETLLPSLPNPLRGPEGQVYLSNADFLCPDDCPEPRSICTVTGKPRPRVMHRFLSDLHLKNYTPVVLRSLQLAPGVGGFKAATLWDLYTELRARRGRFLFSTACKCHAVMHAFSLS